MKNRAWIEERLKSLKKKKGDLAAALDLPNSRITELIKGERQLRLTEVPIFADFMMMPHEEVIVKFSLTNSDLVYTNHIIANIRGYVQAGQWGEANEMHLGDQDIMYASPKYPTAYGLIVKGDSMNDKYKDGARLVCVPVDDFTEEIKPGYSVIVEAVCYADDIETTVKEYYKDEDGTEWLIPRSTNPKYQNYPVPHGEELDIVLNGRRVKDIQIKAVVTEVYQSEID